MVCPVWDEVDPLLAEKPVVALSNDLDVRNLDHELSMLPRKVFSEIFAMRESMNVSGIWCRAPATATCVPRVFDSQFVVCAANISSAVSSDSYLVVGVAWSRRLPIRETRHGATAVATAPQCGGDM